MRALRSPVTSIPMEQSKRIFEDMSRMAGGAASLLGGMRQQLQDDIRQRVEEMAARMDLVARDELEQLQESLNKLRADHTALEKRLAALEGPKKATKKTTAKKTAPKTGGKKS